MSGAFVQMKGWWDPPSGAPPRPIDLALDFSLQGASGTSHILLWPNSRAATSLLSPLVLSEDPPPSGLPHSEDNIFGGV